MKFNIKKLKLLLADKGSYKEYIVLNDMDTPVVLNAGLVLVAQTRVLDGEMLNEESVADFLIQTSRAFAFYELLPVEGDDSKLKIRYATF